MSDNGAIGTTDTSKLDGEAVELRYVELSQAVTLLWERNPKLHDIGALSESLEQHGFRDPPAFDINLTNQYGTPGAIVYGNGRIEALAGMRAQKRTPPRGVLTDLKSGKWFVPIKFGLDAVSKQAAEAFGIDHNSIGLLGGDLGFVEQMGIYDEAILQPLMVELAEFDAPLVSFDYGDVINYDGVNLHQESQSNREKIKTRLAHTVDDEQRENLKLISGYGVAVNTAALRARTGEISEPMQWFEKNGLLVGDVIDYGAGNDPHEYAHFDPVLHPTYDLLNRQWDVITCNYVLHIIPFEHNRIELLLCLRGLLRPGGYILVTTIDVYGEEVITESGYHCGWKPDEWQELFGQFFMAERLKSPMWSWQLFREEDGNQKG